MDPSRRSGESTLDTRDAVAGKGRKRRKRTTAASTVRKIHGKARGRQEAWAATAQPNATERLTRELDQLYYEHRGHQAGTFTAPYRGATSRPQ